MWWRGLPRNRATPRHYTAQFSGDQRLSGVQGSATPRGEIPVNKRPDALPKKIIRA